MYFFLAAVMACQEPQVSRTEGHKPALSKGEGPEARDRAHLDLREERAALLEDAEALSDAMESQGIVAALGGAFAEDVFLLSPTVAIIQGRAAAASFLASPRAPTSMRWDLLKAEVSSDGAHGYTWAEGFYTIDLGTGRRETPGLFLTSWRSEGSGSWRVAALVFDVGSPEPQSVPEGFGTPTNKHRRHFPNSDVDEQRALLLEVDAAFAALSARAGAGSAFLAFAARDAVASGSGELVFGPAAIAEAFTFPEGDALNWTPLQADVAASGDLGFTVGHGTYTSAQGCQNFYTKYLTIWQKQNSGRWKFVADLGNSRPAP